jgi:hypothetical protein
MEAFMRNSVSRSALLLVLCIALSSRAAEPPDIAELLYAWQTSAIDQPALLADAAFADSRNTHNAHELSLAAEFYGPVDARRLIEQFTWSSRSVEGQTVLHAVPRDEFTRLFCAGVDVEWDADQQRPRSLRFYDEPASPRAVAIHPPAAPEHAAVTRVAARPVHTDTLIQLAALNTIEDAPESPLELSEILRRWTDATSRIERAHLEFMRFNYDNLYFVEQRCHGRFRWEAPDRACYELFNSGDDGTAETKRKGPHGEPFIRESADPLMLCWDGNEVIIAHPELRTYDVFDVPSDPEVRQTGSWGRIWSVYADPHRILPGVVDVHSEGLHDRFEWTLLRQDDEQILLCGRPLLTEDQQQLSQLQVILDPQTFRTRATRVYDVTGNRETVHVFCESKFNNDVNYSENWTPDLTDYQQLNSAPPAPPATSESTSQSTRSMADTWLVGVLQAHALLTYIVAQ